MRHPWLDAVVILLASPVCLFAIAFLIALSDFAYSRVNPSTLFEIEW